MRIDIFPGTFDPFTLGHESLVRRGLGLFDEIVIGVGVNENKRSLLPTDRRVLSIEKLYKDEPRVRVEAYSDLTIDFARRMNAGYIIRGIRTVNDFEYEETTADVNRKLSGIETIVFFTEPHLACVSSTIVRELVHFGKDVSAFLPKGYEL
jgi:pantetheine-phosphate adenylyltransferase